MNVRVEPRRAGTAVVSLVGRLDRLTSSLVKQELQETVASGQVRLVVDLSEVSFIDSSGLGALIGVLKSARVAGGDLRIARPRDQVRYVLEISMLDRVLSSHGSVEEALGRYE